MVQTEPLGFDPIMNTSVRLSNNVLYIQPSLIQVFQNEPAWRFTMHCHVSRLPLFNS